MANISTLQHHLHSHTPTFRRGVVVTAMLVHSGTNILLTCLCYKINVILMAKPPTAFLGLNRRRRHHSLHLKADSFVLFEVELTQSAVLHRQCFHSDQADAVLTGGTKASRVDCGMTGLDSNNRSCNFYIDMQCGASSAAHPQVLKTSILYGVLNQ